MSAIHKFLIIAGGLFLTFMLLSFAFWAGREARDSATVVVGKTTKLNSELSESDKTMYDGMEVSGSEVINVINKFKNEELGLIVTTKKSTTYYGYTLNSADSVYSLGNKVSSSIKAAKQITSDTYINSSAQFSCTVLRDKNDVIVGLQFVQI